MAGVGNRAFRVSPRVMSCHAYRRGISSRAVCLSSLLVSCFAVSCNVASCYVMSRHVLTLQLVHVSGQVPSCRFFGVIFHVSRVVASSCVMVCLVI